MHVLLICTIEAAVIWVAVLFAFAMCNKITFHHPMLACQFCSRLDLSYVHTKIVAAGYGTQKRRRSSCLGESSDGEESDMGDKSSKVDKPTAGHEAAADASKASEVRGHH